MKNQLQPGALIEQAKAKSLKKSHKYGYTTPSDPVVKREQQSSQTALQKRHKKTKKMRKYKMPKLGTGKRFSNLTKKLSAKGAKNPKALAAFIGRKKFGGAKMAQLSAHGRKG